jgi:hypothetical protein
MLFFLILTKDQVGKLRQKCTLKCLIRSIVHWTCKRNKKKILTINIITWTLFLKNINDHKHIKNMHRRLT